MKYLLRFIAAVILAEIAVHWLQANSGEYWAMFPYAFTFDSITYDTELWIDSWSPIVYGVFLSASLLPVWLSNTINSHSPECTLLDDI